MIEIAIYSSVIISFLGIAYPILLQVMARLDETYSSTLIIELFEKEPRKKWFQIQLYVSLFIVLIWSLKLKPLDAFSEIGFFIDNSAVILLILTSILLVISFILLVHRIFEYYVPSKFVAYLIKKHNEEN